MSFEDSLSQVESTVVLNFSYATLMGASGVLAAVALLTNSVPVLVGSMVVAPVLPPLELVAFATLQRRTGLVAKGAWVAFVGLFVAAVGAAVTTWGLNVTAVLPASANLLDKPLLAERVRPGWYSVIAAFAAGVAGAVATVENRTDTLVGVVAALAIVPATAAGSIALLSRNPSMAIGGFALLAINVTVIVLTGSVTLLLIEVVNR